MARHSLRERGGSLSGLQPSGLQRSKRTEENEGTALIVYNDGTVKNNRNQNICLAFTVDDIDREYEKVLALGAEIIEPPTKRPWARSK